MPEAAAQERVGGPKAGECQTFSLIFSFFSISSFSKWFPLSQAASVAILPSALYCERSPAAVIEARFFGQWGRAKASGVTPQDMLGKGNQGRDLKTASVTDEM